MRIHSQGRMNECIIFYANPRTKTTQYSDSLYLLENKYFSLGKETALTHLGKQRLAS